MSHASYWLESQAGGALERVVLGLQLSWLASSGTIPVNYYRRLPGWGFNSPLNFLSGEICQH